VHTSISELRGFDLNELEVERKGLSTMRRRVGISGERRLGVEEIPAKEGRRLDRTRSGS
jgi:hypothetical protein